MLIAMHNFGLDQILFTLVYKCWVCAVEAWLNATPTRNAYSN